jgi:hypothetical protein
LQFPGENADFAEECGMISYFIGLKSAVRIKIIEWLGGKDAR